MPKKPAKKTAKRPTTNVKFPELRPEPGRVTGSDTALKAVSMRDTGPLRRKATGRKAIAVPVDLQLITARGETVATGQAVIRDLSLEGAYLDDIVINEAIPEQVSELHLAFTVIEGPLKGMTAKCAPVRVCDGFSGLGVSLVGGFHVWIE